MAKPDESGDEKTPITADDIKSVVETANAEDEKDKDLDDDQEDENSDEEESNADGEGSEDDEESEDDESDEDDESKEKDPKAAKKEDSTERKFKNLAADDDAEYISNIEKAYEESSAEAIRLNQELGQTKRRVDAILQAVAKDPDLADRLTKALGSDPSSSGTDDNKGGDNSPAPTDNPFLVSAETEFREKSRQEVQEILDANPEILTDQKLNEDVRHWMEIFSAEHYKKEGKLLSGGAAMTQAMKHLGIEDKRQKQQVASKAKDLAAPSRPQGSRKPKKSTKQVSDAAYKFGELMGVSREKVEKYA